MTSPPAGVDIGSKAEIIALVRDLAAEGKAVIVISSELAELLTAADRIIVMVDGRIVSESDRSAFDDPDPGDDLGAQAAIRRAPVFHHPAEGTRPCLTSLPAPQSARTSPFCELAPVHHLSRLHPDLRLLLSDALR